MNTNEIHYQSGFFRLTNGSWVPTMFEKFYVETYEMDEGLSYYVMGLWGYTSPPSSLAGPFDAKEKAQAALDDFFTKGGLNGAR